MLDYGKTIYENKLPVIDNFRDLPCLIIYERWLFATLTTNEASDPPEVDEIYEREKHPEGSLEAVVPKAMFLASWGIPDEKAELLGFAIEEGKNVPEEILNNNEIIKFLVAREMEPLPGPYGWPGDTKTYIKKFMEHLNITKDKPQIDREFQRVWNAQSIFNAVVRSKKILGNLDDRIVQLKYQKNKTDKAEVKKNLAYFFVS